ncbi:adenosine 3'-phospho 5'-phosphosulfate transporter 1 [Atheta coriaria]|uniref:adenosine 3'-phospho 5'-phosphosulfate transporter 1 n=1 Tax=Dalotia coriaria TaxID=877792 RepID=UPI0031F3ED94
MTTSRMANSAPEIIICFIVLLTTGIFILINKSISTSNIEAEVGPDYKWIIHGLTNTLGYMTVLVPGIFVHKYIRKINYLDKNNSGCLYRIIQKCYAEDELIEKSPVATSAAGQRSTCPSWVNLLINFTMLQISFVSWAFLQEKVMTQEYKNDAGEIGHFKDSQFLVFVNRTLALATSGLVILCWRQPRVRCPMYKYAFCSLSNILSSWCQYEALMYVSFPHQVLAKAAKTIPVMIMGKVISRTKYEYYEYVTACILSVGMLFFLLDMGNGKGSTVTTFSGAILLFAYIGFDSFTSNWQGALFRSYSMSPVQMMFAVNLFSCMFTAVSLTQQGNFMTSMGFIVQFPTFLVDCVMLSICSAVGQLFIYKTVAEFGPLVFAIISTIRQGVSLFLSCVFYNHDVHGLGVLGIFLVFFSVLLRIYCGHRIKSRRTNV